MRECLACEKQFDEGDLEQSNRIFFQSHKDLQNTYCSEQCATEFEFFLARKVQESKDSGLINDEGVAIQSAENSPDVVRRIIGGLNIKLTNNNK